MMITHNLAPLLQLKQFGYKIKQTPSIKLDLNKHNIKSNKNGVYLPIESTT